MGIFNQDSEKDFGITVTEEEQAVDTRLACVGRMAKDGQGQIPAKNVGA